MGIDLKTFQKIKFQSFPTTFTDWFVFVKVWQKKEKKSLTKLSAKMVKEEKEKREGEKKFEAKTSSLIFLKKFSENNFCSLEKFPFSTKLFGSTTLKKSFWI